MKLAGVKLPDVTSFGVEHLEDSGWTNVGCILETYLIEIWFSFHTIEKVKLGFGSE